MSSIEDLGFQYIKICNEIKEANDKLKQIKSKKKDLNTKILSTMAEKNISEVNLSNGTIFLDKKEMKESINKKNIIKSLESYCEGNTTEADRIANAVLKNIPKKKINKIRVDC